MRRNPTLDGVRGLLALDVLCSHAFPTAPFPFSAGFYAVWGFFILSSYVLVKSWDGRYLAFLARRFVRLWPIYALCLVAGFFLCHQRPNVSMFFFSPIAGIRLPNEVDPPRWSLVIEMDAMVWMPILVWSAVTPVRGLIVAVACAIAALCVSDLFLFGVLFVLGAGLTRYEPRLAILEGAIPQWLGRISYPLYLSHWLVLHHVNWPILPRLVLTFAVADVLARTVERSSIALSRKI